MSCKNSLSDRLALPGANPCRSFQNIRLEGPASQVGSSSTGKEPWLWTKIAASSNGLLVFPHFGQDFLLNYIIRGKTLQ